MQAGIGHTSYVQLFIFLELPMITDQRTGMRSIRAARETFASVALVTLMIGTVLRCIEGQPGGVAGAILTLIALAIVSRYRVSWDKEGIVYQNPFWSRQKPWTELSAYSIEPQYTGVANMRAAGHRHRPSAIYRGSRLRLHGRRNGLTISLKPFSYQDIRHLTDAVSTELPAHETAAALVS